MDTQNVISRTPVSSFTTVGQLREQYGATFAEGYEDSDPITNVLGRAGTSSLGEYLRLYEPVAS